MVIVWVSVHFDLLLLVLFLW